MSGSSENSPVQSLDVGLLEKMKSLKREKGKFNWKEGKKRKEKKNPVSLTDSTRLD